MNCSERMKLAFGSFALFIASHPWKFCIISFLINGFLGLGMLNLPKEKLLNNDIEDVYMPRHTTTEKTAQSIHEFFPETSKDAFYSHQIVQQPLYAELILWRKNKQSIINETLHSQITSLIRSIENVSIYTENGKHANYRDLCARRNGKCILSGEEVIEKLLESKDGQLNLHELLNENTTIFENPLFQLADYHLENNSIVRATYLKIRFNLCQDTPLNTRDAKKWMNQFLSYMKALVWHSDNLSVTFSHSKSFLEELGNDTYNDIPYFSFVFTVFFTYIGFVMSGGNILAKRAHIGRMGIIVTPTSVLGAWGLLMACKIEFTNVIGITPVLIVSHQIINTMITLSHLSDANDETEGQKRVEYAVRMSALPITVMMLCYVVPFSIAIFSKYLAIELVSIYIVTTMLFNYVNHFVFYTACIAIHEQRIDSGRHCCICTKLRPREELQDRNCCIICCCSGSRPERRTDTESSVEKVTRIAMLRYLITTSMRCIASVFFLALMVCSIFGLVYYRIDTLQQNEIISESFFNKWYEIDHTNFKQEPIIQFVTLHPTGFANDLAEIFTLRQKLEHSSFLQQKMQVFWKTIYDNTLHENNKSDSAFYESVRKYFIPNYAVFANDIHFNENHTRIFASRFYIKAHFIPSTESLLSLRKEVNNICDEINDLFKTKYENEDQSLKLGDRFVFVHSPDFFAIDDYMQPLWEILRFTGTQTGLLIMISICLKPCISYLILLPITYTSMMSAVFGLSHFMGVYLTQVSQIMYMVAGCFCVETLVHVFYSFTQTAGFLKSERVNVVLNNTSQAIFHTIFGQLLGILVLIVVRSYVFVTVFRLTLLTTIICLFFTLFWIPNLLYIFGPVGSKSKAETLESYKIEISAVSFDRNTKNNIDGIDNSSFEHRTIS